MFCLVYRSIASPIFGQVQMQEMLEKAREFNDRNGISGCLLYYDGEFIQYLEGNQVKVLKLFDKIRHDRRHSDISVLSHSQIQSREFDKWNMAFENFLGENDQLQFLKLLVSSYIKNPKKMIGPNPTSILFWKTAKRLLNSNPSQRYI
ncbi:MAG: BLUF domain-containing protein [Bacteroidota bacterium]